MAETFIQSFFAYVFVIALLLVYIVVPLTIAYFLYKRKFMTERMRYLFASVLLFNIAFIVFMVLLDLLG